MTAFGQQPRVAADAEFESIAAQPVKRPSRLSMSNWPVRWKVFAIVLVPLLLAGVFGGLRVYSGWTDASDLKLAADRAEMVPAVNDFSAALESAMIVNSTGGDPQSALAAFDTSKQSLQRHLADTDVSPDVAKGVKALLEGGQSLLDKVTANSISLRDRITMYTPLLLTAEDVVVGSVRVDDAQIRAEAQGLSRAMGARGQMMMQQLLVNLGGELPEPELRVSMVTVAGTEPSTLFGMAQVLGVGSPEAQQLQAEFVKREGLMSDPTVPLVNNPDLTQSIQATNDIAGKLIASMKSAVAKSVADQSAAKRSEAIRDSIIVAVAFLIAILIVSLVARTLVRPLRRLRDGALKVAHEDLARELERVRAGGTPGPVQPLPVHSSEEIGQVAHAVDELHEQAVLLAGEQVNLQMQVDDMFETLSRRNRSLVDQQLTLIDSLERDEEDPQRLESLFRLDHLAARMRRNGANLMVLAGSKVPREQADPVPVAAIINAAASEVEDYARIVTASVPDSEVLGTVAGDLVHLLAEILDNALRYSPPISQVRVSAVHTGNGGLVFEISDIGLGMAESDLRVANTRLQSGGEVNPYTARHMGLFVVGRLAAQHGLIVRLRSTVAGESNSGTTAGVFLPAGLLLEQPGGYHDSPADQDVPADAHAGIMTALALDHFDADEPHQGHYDTGDAADYFGHGDYPVNGVYQDTSEYAVNGDYDVNGVNGVHQGASEYTVNGDYAGEYTDDFDDYGATDETEAEYRNGHVDIPVSLLPQRNPGASGISGIPSLPPEPVVEPESDWADDDEEWPEDSMPAQGPVETSRAPVPPPPPPPPPQPQRPTPADTSAFFSSRQQVAGQQPAANGVPSNGVPSNGVPSNGVHRPAPPAEPEHAPELEPEDASEQHGAEESVSEGLAGTDTNSIFDKMLSEWLIDDPHELANSTDLDWQTVWDHGWEAAAAAEDAPVAAHTESGLPVREPGARLVPGAADDENKANGRHRNGDADVARTDGPGGPPPRDPETVRSTISDHFGGVHAGRTHARDSSDSRETDQR